MDFLSAWHLWVIFGFLALVLEIKLSGFIMLWFAVGAFVTALAAAMGFGMTGQMALFLAVSIALFASSRTIFQRFFMMGGGPVMKVGAEAMLGAEATVIEALPETGSGTVRINGELWAARSVDGPVAAGELVEVASVDGLKLKVRRTQQAPVVLAVKERQ
jgi:membrane protein implicated in regulation of membrane protease activity